MQSLSNSHINGLTLLGGDPFMPFNVTELIDLCATIRKLHPTKTIWAYSGWLFEDVIKDSHKLELLKLCDVLVDGKFIQELYSPKLRFRGSSNQRIIDVQESLKQNKVILYIED